MKTRGPLPTPRSPQGRPVIMQAGSSERGRQFAARWAEVIFTLQHSKADMQAFYADIKTRMAKHDRAPEECIITPAVDIVLGETKSIANERAEYLNSLVSAELGVCDISNGLGVDLAKFSLDQPLENMDIPDGARGVLDVILQGTRASSLTLRQAGYRYGVNQLTPTLIGTPEMVADRLQDMFESHCCDGFVICPSITPGTYVQFVKTVVPELQRRGIYRTDYAGATLRQTIRNDIAPDPPIHPEHDLDGAESLDGTATAPIAAYRYRGAETIPRTGALLRLGSTRLHGKLAASTGQPHGDADGGCARPLGPASVGDFQQGIEETYKCADARPKRSHVI